MSREEDRAGAFRLWFGGLLVIVGAHALWQALNQTPPVWDMAHHQLMGRSYLHAILAGDWESLFELSNYYPPFYYLLETLALGLGSSFEWLPFWTNLPGLCLLSYSLFRMGSEHGAWSGIVSGHLPLLFPLVAWTSRESLIDPWLAAWVGLAYWLLTRNFLERDWIRALLFGIVAGLGLLTKWTFPLFLLPGILHAGVLTSDRRRFLLRSLDAALAALPLTLWWYLPNLSSLLLRFESTAAAAGWERDPGLGSMLGWLYYPRCLASYYLFLPLTAIVLVSVFFRWRDSSRGAGPVTSGLIGSIAFLTLLTAKDPRYVMPAAGLLACFTAVSLAGRSGWLKTAWFIAWIQFFAVSFPLPFLPERVSLGTLPEDADFQSMRQEWVFFQTHYFHISGPPKREDWHYDQLIALLESGESVGVVPDAPRLNPSTLLLEAAARGKRLDAFRLGMGPDWERKVGHADWVIGKTGSQGISYVTVYNDRVYEFLETLNWPLVKSWDLPDGTLLLIWRRPSR